MNKQKNLSSYFNVFGRFFKKALTMELTASSMMPPKENIKYKKIERWENVIVGSFNVLIVPLWACIGLLLLHSIDHSLVMAGIILGTMIGMVFVLLEYGCYTSIQEEFDKAQQRSGDVHIWREGLLVNIYGGGETCTVAKAPLSSLYLICITHYLTGRMP